MKSSTDLVLSLPKSFLLIGAPGTGKTTFALQLPKPYLIDCDSNLDGPVRYLSSTAKLPSFHYDSPLTDKLGKPTERGQRFDRVLELVHEAINAPDVDTIIIDSLTSLADFALDKVRVFQGRKFGNNSTKADDPLQIQDWGVFQSIIKQLVFYVKSTNKRLVICAHMTVDKDELSGILQNFLNLPGSLKHTLSGWFEEAWNLYIEVQGAGATVKNLRKIRTVADARNAPLGLKSSIGLPSAFDADAELVLKAITK